MFYLEPTTRFKKDLKKIKKSKKDFEAVVNVLRLLQKNGVLAIPEKMRPHRLKGDYKDNWECHIKPDLLIIWFQMDADGIIKLIRVGSHSELFK